MIVGLCMDCRLKGLEREGKRRGRMEGVAGGTTMGKERRDRKNENIWTKFALLSTFLLHFLSLLRAGGSYVLRAP